MKTNTENMMKNQGLAHSQILTKAMVAAAAMLGTASVSQAFTTANLLVDPSFETQTANPFFSSVVANFPANQGVWGAENGSFVGPTTGVVPFLSQMHEMQASGSVSQTIQITSLAPYAAEIAAGNATFDMSALFNVPAGQTGAIGGIAVRFFTTDWNSRFGNTGSTAVLDSSGRTWEEITHSGAIPTNAAWIGTELVYNSNSLNGGQGFVDEALLTITTVPEPSSALLCVLGALGLVSKRKRG